MRYKLFVIVFVVIISFSFFSSLVSAKHMGGPLTKAEAARAMIIFGDGEDAIKRRCAENYPGASAQKMQECIDMYKNGFCWWIKGERNYHKGLGEKTENVGAYDECIRDALGVKIDIIETGTRAIQLGTMAVPGPSVAGGAVTQTVKTIIDGAKAADDIIKQGKEMEERKKEKEKLDKTSMLESLEKNFLGKKINDAGALASTYQNAQISFNILEDPHKEGERVVSLCCFAQFVVKITDGEVVQVSSGNTPNTNLDIFISKSRFTKLLNARTGDEAKNLILSGLKDGSLKVTGKGANNVVLAFVQNIGTIFSKFQPSLYDVKKGVIKTINFEGTSATLQQNNLRQRVISVDNSKVVHVVSRGGERLGYSTAGTQNLLKDCSPVKKAYGQCTKTAGYYSDITTPTAGYYTGITTSTTTVTTSSLSMSKEELEELEKEFQEKSVGGARKVADSMKNLAEAMEGFTKAMEDLLDNPEEVGKIVDKLKEKGVKDPDTVIDLIEKFVKEGREFTDATEALADAMDELADTMGAAGIQPGKEESKKAKEAADKVNEASSNAVKEGEDVKEAGNELKETLQEELGDNWKEALRDK